MKIMLKNIDKPNYDVDIDSYVNYLGLNVPDLVQDSTYMLVLEPAFKDKTYPEYFKVWIDFDQDQIFDENEVVYRNSDGVISATNGTISIPKDAIVGITRMRVIMSSKNDISSCHSSNDRFGEVEDYCVNILLSTNTKHLSDLVDIFIYITG